MAEAGAAPVVAPGANGRPHPISDMRIQAPPLKSADSGESGMHIGREQAIQHALLSASGVQRPGYMAYVCYSTAADLAAAAVNELPPDVRKIVEAPFF